MIRTKTVELTTIPAIACRQKLPSGGSGITILRSDSKQPGIASISKTSGDPIPTAQTDLKKFPIKAFKEAIELTTGLPYKKQPSPKANEKLLVAAMDKAKLKEEEVVINSDEYQMIVDRYTDKNGKLSYELMNKDFIRFAKQSSIVRQMIADQKSVTTIRNYIVAHKFKNITGNEKLTGKELKKMVELLDEVSPKGVYKELNSELKKMLAEAKRTVE